MSSTWTVQLLKLSWLFVLAAAVVVFVPFGAAHHHSGPGQNQATVDDILDDPQHYVGEEVTLEGEIDHIYSTTVLAMEDDQDLIGEDQILILSVMPVGAASAARASTGAATSDDLKAVPAVEVVRLVDGEYREGKIVEATGTIRMFDRATLEQEFGHLDLGSATAAEFDNKPVLVMGARQYADLRQRQVEQQAAVIPPVSQPKPQVTEPARPPEPALESTAPEPVTAEPQEPVAEPEPSEEIAEALPRTATPLPAVGLAGFLSLLAGLSLALFRK